MLMTEVEARQKKNCPLGNWRPCLGSGCMMWRWASITKWSDDTVTAVVGYEQSDKGYCGLAGKPEMLP